MKKLIALLLVAVMVLSVFISCSDTPDDDGSNKDSAGADGTNAGSDTESSATELNLPDVNYDGREFRVLSKGTSQAHWKSMDLTADEMSSDAISLAVYYRNLAVEEKYGITVVEYAVADYFNQLAEVTLSCGAGTDEYDMLCLKPEAVISSLVNNGYLIDLNEMTYMNLDAEWYDHNSIEQLSLGGKTFLATGAMLVMDDDATGAVFFNKGLAAVYEVEDLYKKVDDGSWTIDEMNKWSVHVATDDNGNGSMDVASDIWGCLTEKSTTLAFVAGGNLRIMDKNSEDYPVVAAGSEQYYNMLDKVLLLSNNFESTMFAEALSGYGDVWVEALDVAFNEDRALFYAAWLNRATLFRSMETDFGILPYPKYDTDQQTYHSFVSLYCANSISVPYTVTDIDFVSTAIEALSYESMYNKNSLTEAYYTKTLESKGARDEQSQRMLDIIFENTVFDLGYMYNWGGICSTITNMAGVANGTADGFSGKVTAITKATNKAIEKTMDKVFEY